MPTFCNSNALTAIRLGLLAFLAAATVGSPALGQSEGSWQCAADNGRYVENPQPLSSSVRSLSGRIQFERGLTDGQWDPVANIGFANAASGSNCNCAGLRATIYPSQPNIVTFYVVANGQEIGIAQSPLGRPITFQLSIDDAGVLKAVVGKTSPTVKSVKLRDPRRDYLHMSCSSAEVTFLDVQAS